MVIIFQQKQLQNSDIDLRRRRKLTCIPASHMKQINNISTNSHFFLGKIYNSCQTSEISSDYDIFL